VHNVAYKKSLWVGIGCQKGISQGLIKAAIEKVFQEYQLVYNEIQLLIKKLQKLVW